MLQRLFSRFSGPAGPLGHVAGWIMARKNRALNAWVTDRLAVGPDDRVVEIGFGPGLAVERNAARATRGLVAGVDRSEVMWRHARRRNAGAIAAGRVDLRVSDATALPFEDASFSRALAVNSLAALRRVPFDAIVLDGMLPDIDGFEMCRRVRADSDVPIVMLTARGDEADRIVGLELGAADYLPKPFNPRELGARVEIEGRDEVAVLARSFNASAERIERLVESQRTLLAGVSHELRTPLARIRVASELLADAGRPELRAHIERDVAALDDGIGELLLASRLDAHPALAHAEPVDLLALAAEEAAGTGAQASGEPVTIEGDERMLRRLVRNLLDNAQRHAGGAAVRVDVSRGAHGRALLRVDDAGPGIPEAECERIFEPFQRLPGARGTAGLGLGLALVRRIARHHGGDARCLPRPGGGTRFEVTFRT